MPLHLLVSSPYLNIKAVFTDMGIVMIKIRRTWDRLIFIMGIPILVKQHLYIEWNDYFGSNFEYKDILSAKKIPIVEIRQLYDGLNFMIGVHAQHLLTVPRHALYWRLSDETIWVWAWMSNYIPSLGWTYNVKKNDQKVILKMKMKQAFQG